MVKSPTKVMLFNLEEKCKATCHVVYCNCLLLSECLNVSHCHEAGL